MWIRRFALALTCTLCLLDASSNAEGKSAALPGIQFFGQIQAVDPIHKTVTVKHGAIPGFADRETTDYSVDDDSILKRLQAGDDIRATVFQNDHTLHGIRIVSHSRLNQQKKSGK